LNELVEKSSGTLDVAVKQEDTMTPASATGAKTSTSDGKKKCRKQKVWFGLFYCVLNCSLLYIDITTIIIIIIIQGHSLSGKPGNVRDFHSCQGNVGDFTRSQRSVRK